MAAVSPMPISESAGEEMVMGVHEVFMVFGQRADAPHRQCGAFTRIKTARQRERCSG
jgi:hypothetical protein